MMARDVTSPFFAAGRSELWYSQSDEHSLCKDSQSVKQDEDSLLYMLEDQTPSRDLTEMAYHAFSTAENADKTSEKCRITSQLKRRRVLQFDSETDDLIVCTEQFTDAIAISKVSDESLLDVILHDEMQWLRGCSDDGNATGHGSPPHSSAEWLSNCVNDTDINFYSDEMISSDAFEGQIDISELCNIPSEEHVSLPQVATPSPRIKIKGVSKSLIGTPIKSTTVACPFTLIKPCGDKDMTLKDINQRIHSPFSPSLKNGESSVWYPTSAFSGKPVVAKTRIRTCVEGSITIMRTKG